MKMIKIAGVKVNVITKSDLVTITPADAERILRHNDNFRKVDGNEAIRYADMIKSGDWQFNGDTIAFDTHGNLKDGQHRMKACVISNKPMKIIPILVDSDLHTDYKRKMYCGHIMKSKGIVNFNATAAMTRIIYLSDKNGIEYAFTNKSQFIPSMKLWEFYQDHPLIQESMDATHTHCHVYRANIPHSVLAAFYYFASQIDKSAATRFVETVGMTMDEFQAKGFRKTDPLTKLKEYIATDSKETKISTVMKAAHLILAWNYMRQNKPCTKLHWIAVGPDAEDFPTIM